MKYTHERVITRIGNKGYLDLVAIFLSMGFENVHDVPDFLWATAIAIYEERMFRDAA